MIYKKRNFPRLLIILILTCPSESQKNDPNENLKVIWNTSTNLIDTPQSELLIIDNFRLIYSGEEDIIALSLETGELKWKGEIEGWRDLQSYEMLYDSEHNWIISPHFENLIVWDASNGDKVYELIESETGISISTASRHTLMQNGYAMVGSPTDLNLFSWDGKLKLSQTVPWTSRSIVFSASKLFIGQRNTVHGGLTQGRIRAFDAATGDSLWVYQTDNDGFHTRLYVHDGNVYGGTRGNSPNSEVVALDAETGEIIWQYITDNPLEYADYFLVADDYVFTRGTGYAFALDKQTGERLWGFGWGSSTSVNMVYLEGYLYLSNRGAVYVLDAETGELVHTEPSPSGDGYIYKLGVSEDKLFVQTGASIIAYEPWHLRGDQ